MFGDPHLEGVSAGHSSIAVSCGTPMLLTLLVSRGMVASENIVGGCKQTYFLTLGLECKVRAGVCSFAVCYLAIRCPCALYSSR